MDSYGAWIKMIVPQKEPCWATSIGFLGWWPSPSRFSIAWLAHILPTSWRCPVVKRWKKACCCIGCCKGQGAADWACWEPFDREQDGSGSVPINILSIVFKLPHIPVNSCYAWGTQRHRMCIYSIVLFQDTRIKQWYHFCIKMNAAAGCTTVTQSPQAFESPEHEPCATVELRVNLLSLMRLQFSACAHRQPRKRRWGLNYKGPLSREEQCVWNQCFGRKRKQIRAKISFGR